MLSKPIEHRAASATKLPSFPINLPEIRRSVAEILALFGRDRIFTEYTRHDITHIDDMLATAEWIIPDATKSILSDAEWLTIVLSIYFHDMGLVVTETEFQHRADSGFRAFCNHHLFTGSGGADYQAKIGLLDPDHKERFLYQEYVRANHGRRIRAWIEGTQNPDLGYAKVQIEEIDRLLRPLDTDYRRPGSRL